MAAILTLSSLVWIAIAVYMADGSVADLLHLLIIGVTAVPSIALILWALVTLLDTAVRAAVA